MGAEPGPGAKHPQTVLLLGMEVSLSLPKGCLSRDPITQSWNGDPTTQSWNRGTPLPSPGMGDPTTQSWNGGTPDPAHSTYLGGISSPLTGLREAWAGVATPVSPSLNANIFPVLSVPGNGCTEWHLGAPRSTASWDRWQGAQGPHGEPVWRGSPGKQPAPGGKASYVNQREMSNVSPHDCQVIRGRATLIFSKRLILMSRRLVFCCR